MRPLTLMALGAALAWGQATPAQASSNGTPQFEVASLKVQKTAPIDPLQPRSVTSALQIMKGGPGTNTPGRIHYANVTLMSLLTKAYDVRDDQVVGPGWLSQDHYMIDAIVPNGATREQFRQMLQKLIVKRFKLAFRWEEKDLTVYSLRLPKTVRN